MENTYDQPEDVSDQRVMGKPTNNNVATKLEALYWQGKKLSEQLNHVFKSVDTS